MARFVWEEYFKQDLGSCCSSCLTVSPSVLKTCLCIFVFKSSQDQRCLSLLIYAESRWPQIGLQADRYRILTEEATLMQLNSSSIDISSIGSGSIGSSSIGSSLTAPRLMAAQNRIMRMELISGLHPFLTSPVWVPPFTIKEQSADAEQFYDWSCVLWLSHIHLACVKMWSDLKHVRCSVSCKHLLLCSSVCSILYTGYMLFTPLYSHMYSHPLIFFYPEPHRAEWTSLVPTVGFLCPLKMKLVNTWTFYADMMWFSFLWRDPPTPPPDLLIWLELIRCRTKCILGLLLNQISNLISWSCWAQITAVGKRDDMVEQNCVLQAALSCYKHLLTSTNIL